jgi:T5orf172 domain.
MAEKGIIYVMTTAVTGLIKIGRTETRQFEQRMKILESNGYYNVVGLKRYFAIEVEDYIDKEKLIHEIFNKHKVAESELFALDQEIIKQLLLCFEGRVIYPENVNQEKEFEKISKTRKKGELFSFYKKGLKNGDKISFIKDKSIVATVCGEREVEYNGQVWKLSPLTYKILEDRGELNESGAYQGAAYFEYNGKKLKDLPDIE